MASLFRKKAQAPAETITPAEAALFKAIRQCLSGDLKDMYVVLEFLKARRDGTCNSDKVTELSQKHGITLAMLNGWGQSKFGDSWVDLSR